MPILSENPLFFILNSYTTGLSPAVMEYLLGVLLQKRFGGKVSSGEIGLPVTETGAGPSLREYRDLGVLIRQHIGYYNMFYTIWI